MVDPAPVSRAAHGVKHRDRQRAELAEFDGHRHRAYVLVHDLLVRGPGEHRRWQASPFGFGHGEGGGPRQILVLGPQLPDGVAPCLELAKERVALDNVGRLGQGAAVAVDLVAQELDVLAAGGLVVQGNLDGIGARDEEPIVGQIHGIVAARILLGRKVAGRVGSLPDRLCQPAGGLVDAESLGRNAIVLVTPVGQDKMEGLGLPGEGAAGMHLVDQLVDVALAWGQRRTVGRIRRRQALERADSAIIGIDLVDQLSAGIGPYAGEHAPSLRKARDQLVAGLVLDAEGDGPAGGIVGQILNGRGLEQLLAGAVHPAQDGLRIEAVALAEVQRQDIRALVQQRFVDRAVVGRAGRGAGQHVADPHVAAGQIVDRLAALRVLDAAVRSHDGIGHVGAFAHRIGHVAVLAGGDSVAGLRGGKDVRCVGTQAQGTALLAIVGQHELGEGALDMEIGVGRLGLAGQRRRAILAQVGQGRVGYIVTGAAKVLALVIAAVEHAVAAGGVGEGGPLVTTGAGKVLA